MSWPIHGGLPIRGLTHFQVFGARLAEMAVDDGGLPPVFRQAMDLIRNDGLDTEGIFRRSVSHATLKTVKQLFNDGRCTVRLQSRLSCFNVLVVVGGWVVAQGRQALERR